MTSSLLLSSRSVEEEMKTYLHAPISGVADSTKYHAFRYTAVWVWRRLGPWKWRYL